MAIVVKWAEDGEYLSELGFDRISRFLEWSAHQRDAIRFPSRDAALEAISSHLGKAWDGQGSLRFIRLVPRKRHTSPQP